MFQRSLYASDAETRSPLKDEVPESAQSATFCAVVAVELSVATSSPEMLRKEPSEGMEGSIFQRVL